MVNGRTFVNGVEVGANGRPIGDVELNATREFKVKIGDQEREAKSLKLVLAWQDEKKRLVEASATPLPMSGNVALTLDVGVQSLIGDLRVKADVASVYVTASNKSKIGTCTASSSSGNVAVHGVEKLISCSSMSGDVTVECEDAKGAHISSMSGDVKNTTTGKKRRRESEPESSDDDDDDDEEEDEDSSSEEEGHKRKKRRPHKKRRKTRKSNKKTATAASSSSSKDAGDAEEEETAEGVA